MTKKFEVTETQYMSTVITIHVRDRTRHHARSLTLNIKSSISPWTDGDKTVREETYVLCEIRSVKFKFLSKVFLRMQVFWEVTLCHQANCSHVLMERNAFIFRESQGPRPPDPCRWSTVVVWNMGTTRQTTELHPRQPESSTDCWLHIKSFTL